MSPPPPTPFFLDLGETLMVSATAKIPQNFVHVGSLQL